MLSRTVLQYLPTSNTFLKISNFIYYYTSSLPDGNYWATLTSVAIIQCHCENWESRIIARTNDTELVCSWVTAETKVRRRDETAITLVEDEWSPPTDGRAYPQALLVSSWECKDRWHSGRSSTRSIRRTLSKDRLQTHRLAWVHFAELLSSRSPTLRWLQRGSETGFETRSFSFLWFSFNTYLGWAHPES